MFWLVLGIMRTFAESDFIHGATREVGIAIGLQLKHSCPLSAKKFGNKAVTKRYNLCYPALETTCN
ncbi:MAG: hypothetical protein Q4Q30_03270 [Eggerthella sp.]|nr:hypothetical protein [Eggerthella sp.]